ncbi:MAG TPA: NAD(P)/FAD-dependent oxidoreductase [Candidatus Diapherotrites archaeon]|uniref:NAD(P)/FAD-dependent oxidoreductase n=1 Tax=Candidatus Iainarchaeum sp. TaxID=3101447 RepID=A0A7J4JHA7_9ARCH|nr:NAD(P)/FAD-dependent oxidoreductase [Candidatus Diapherotrites archaeon]HIH17132.1 NAD(P)/FAD-dependent oxidoreductase [Candidatus Diapherotrites archaeon]
MTEEYAAAVVGAGPVGLNAAIQVQKNGFDVVVLEDSEEIGLPCQCSGLISRSGYEGLGLKYDKTIVNRVRGARIFAPDRTEFKVERFDTVAYVIDRPKLDKVFARDAKELGVDIWLNSSVVDVKDGTVFYKNKAGKGEMVKAKAVVGADGIVSTVRKSMGIEAQKEWYVPGYQITGRGKFDPDFVEVHFGPWADKFFAWVIPESKTTARIGLGVTGKNARTCLEQFMDDRGIKAQKLDFQAGVIPAGPPVTNLVKDNVLLAGDAAFQAKATTGGGIMLGIEASNHAAKAIVDHFKYKTPLTSYQKHVEPVTRELEIHWRVRRYLNQLNDEDLNKLFQRMKAAGMEKFLSDNADMDKPSSFLKKVAGSPKMWMMLPEMIKFLRG